MSVVRCAVLQPNAAESFKHTLKMIQGSEAYRKWEFQEVKKRTKGLQKKKDTQYKWAGHYHKTLAVKMFHCQNIIIIIIIIVVVVVVVSCP